MVMYDEFVTLSAREVHRSALMPSHINGKGGTADFRHSNTDTARAYLIWAMAWMICSSVTDVALLSASSSTMKWSHWFHFRNVIVVPG